MACPPALVNADVGRNVQDRSGQPQPDRLPFAIDLLDVEVSDGVVVPEDVEGVPVGKPIRVVGDLLVEVSPDDPTVAIDLADSVPGKDEQDVAARKGLDVEPGIDVPAQRRRNHVLSDDGPHHVDLDNPRRSPLGEERRPDGVPIRIVRLDVRILRAEDRLRALRTGREQRVGEPGNHE